MKAEYEKKTKKSYPIKVGKINFWLLRWHFIHEG